ncbi:restriction endonuclease subunit S [Lactobacillus mulieris]|uniref:restriction endonuclease subunit S n=1 Tax=Lactobacillus mulieris TaxID=2508708 RepID=UPI0009BC60C9|nr:restriction endonuclease subunit S [Lactobacillus mulieris]MDK6563210.1 restriction endonuclease subunit S [Lactobacillus mulieris]MDK8082547.1 restriction endonuclease subunit S [Lactobacillus mulieris]TVV23112.1 restriction endonuclease subunit S [Lactobacillus jensenii]
MYPKVRFRGFDEPWKKVKLGQIADVRDGTHESPKYVSQNGYPLITSKNLENGTINFDDISYISKKDYEEINKRSLVEKNDILFGMIGTIGNVAIVKKSGFAIKNVALIKSNSEIPSINLIQIIQSDIFKKYTNRLNSGNSQKFISLGDIRKFDFKMASKSENMLISKLFKKVDTLLSLQQRKLELMKQLYRYLLENLNTEKKHPNIFIKGNYSHWNKVKLSDLGEIRTGKTPTPSVRSNYTNIGMPFVTPTEIVDLYNYNTSRFISNSGLKKAQIAPKGSILVTCIASIGKNTCVFKEKVAFNQQINAVTPNSFNDSTFLAFKSLQWSKRIDCLTANTAMQIINKKDFSNIETMVPNLNEQKDISKIWLKSYSLTYKYSDAKKLIIRLKKFLLQNLFI